jgi:hypothetical protein
LPINHTAFTLPGFELLTWQTFLLGLIGNFVWGWYIALIVDPLFNFSLLIGKPDGNCDYFLILPSASN